LTLKFKLAQGKTGIKTYIGIHKSVLIIDVGLNCLWRL